MGRLRFTDAEVLPVTGKRLTAGVASCATEVDRKSAKVFLLMEASETKSRAAWAAICSGPSDEPDREGGGHPDRAYEHLYRPPEEYRPQNPRGMPPQPLLNPNPLILAIVVRRFIRRSIRGKRRRPR